MESDTTGRPRCGITCLKPHRWEEISDLFANGLHNYSGLGRHVGLGAASVEVILSNAGYTGYRVFITNVRDPEATVVFTLSPLP